MNSPSFTCRCLNICIRPQPTDSPKPSLVSKGFEWVFIGETGVQVTHTEVTLRSRSRPISVTRGGEGDNQPETRRAQHTYLTCLICQNEVYRITAEVPLDFDAREGPVVPTDDWVERDALRSKDGWIEVHENSPRNPSIPELTSSSQYSSIFKLLLPPPPSSSVLSPPQPPEALPSKTPKFFTLPPLPPAIPPVPFSPSHPVFAHFSKLATQSSEQLRKKMELEIQETVRDKLKELYDEEVQLKKEVDTLWTTWRENLKLQIAHANEAASNRRQSEREREFYPVKPGSAIPTPPKISSALPNKSALSASLAQRGFHHPAAVAAPPPYNSNPGSEDGSPPPPVNRHAVNSHLEPFKRTLDRNMDVVASLKVSAFHAPTRPLPAEEPVTIENPPPSQPTKDYKPSPPPIKRPVLSARLGNGVATTSVTKAPIRERTLSSDSTQSPKRKVVTFESVPDVVTITREITKEATEKAEATEENAEELVMFELDDADAEEYEIEDVAIDVPIKPALNGHSSPHEVDDLLPAANQSRQSALAASLRPSSSSRPRPVRTQATPAPEPDQFNNLLPHEVELMKLVAAGTPSHRSAWRKEGAAWDLFDKRPRKGKEAQWSTDEALENEYVVDPSQPTAAMLGLPASLPVSIMPQGRISAPVGGSAATAALLSPMQDETTDVHRAATFSTTSALRKAAYAERDRIRLKDPGSALDIVQDEDEDENNDREDDEEERLWRENELGRGRERALRILEAKDKVPPTGMWRSLAS